MDLDKLKALGWDIIVKLQSLETAKAELVEKLKQVNSKISEYGQENIGTGTVNSSEQ